MAASSLVESPLLPAVPIAIEGLYSALPFPSIRLLQFKGYESINGMRLLSFRLVSYSWDTKPPYFALSYTWGHPILDDFEDDLSNAILCNGRWLPVGLNLIEALWFFFAEKLNHYDWLWVDAVCINQSNLTERGEQVQLMTQLYAYAKEVLVWLGHEDTDARCAFGLLEEYVPLVKQIIRSEMAENPTTDLVPASKNICDDASFHRRHGTKQRSFGEWRSLIKFFSRRWFKRTWVIQETVLNAGPTLYCGSLQFQWRDLDIFVACVFGGFWYGSNLRDLELSMTETATIFTLHRNIREELRPELSNETVVPATKADVRTFKFFEDCVLRTSMLQATDARDKIYALTGLIRAFTIANNLEVDIPTKADYEAPISKVFREFTMLILYTTRSLDIWSYVIDESARRPDVSVPSWVPQLYQPSAGIMWNLIGMHQSHHFHASSLSRSTLEPAVIDFDFDTQTAQTQGVMVDTVDEVALFTDNDISPCLRLLLNLPKHYLDGKEIQDVWWRTLIADQTMLAYPAPESLQLACKNFLIYQSLVFRNALLRDGRINDLHAYLEPFKQIEAQMPHPAIPTTQEIALIMFDALRDSDAGAKKAAEARASFEEFVPLLNPKITGQAGRALFRTRRDYIGLCPHSTRAGDEVWLLRGAKVFFNFRKIGSKLHKMMGESYVHGLMQGLFLKHVTPQFLEPGFQDWDSIFIK